MTIIEENDNGILYKFSESNYEVWIKYKSVYGKTKGQLIPPADEDFGVRAWSAYTLLKAKLMFEEITVGIRTITPMKEMV